MEAGEDEQFHSASVRADSSHSET